jgi:hypothetical protein
MKKKEHQGPVKKTEKKKKKTDIPHPFDQPMLWQEHQPQPPSEQQKQAKT